MVNERLGLIATIETSSCRMPTFRGSLPERASRPSGQGHSQVGVPFESRDTTVLAFSLAKAGVLGPKLRRHKESLHVRKPNLPPDVFKPVCGDTEMKK
jgi:hypothetical protein